MAKISNLILALEVSDTANNKGYYCKKNVKVENEVI